MTPSDTHFAFERSHPAVGALYLAGMLALTMFSPQPVLVVISLVGALAFSLCCRGVAATARGLVWQVPAMALMALVNPLFSASGSTLLARVGPLAIYAESLAYGACTGAMLVATVLWFECASRVVTQDRLMALMGGVLPTVTLMVSMTARLVPQLLARAREVRRAQQAVAWAGPGGDEAHGRVRLSSVLLGWAMEDSLERSDAMRARGWSASRERTSYQTYRFRSRDAVEVVGLAVALVVCAVISFAACSQWHFYPTCPTLVAWWGYVPYAVWSLVPTIASVVEAISWRR